MKRALLPITLVTLLSVLIYSCSSDSDDSAASSVIQTPTPEAPAPTQYTLSVSSGEGGSVSAMGGTYDEGTSVTITATPNDGYVFTGWSDGSTNSEISITLNSNISLSASFERNIQGGYDQPAVTNARIALIPIDFNDTESSIRENFPTKNELSNIVTSDKLRDYFSTISYDIFEYEVEIFDYINLQQPGLVDGSIYGDEILNTQFEIPNLIPTEFDYLMFVPVHDYQLSGGRQNKWALTINGVNYSYGQINSIMVPILVGYPNRDIQFSFQNSTVYKTQYSIPLGPTDSEEGYVAT